MRAKIFLFLSCRVGRGDRVTVSARGREARCGIAERLPPVSEFHVRQGPHEFQRGLSGRSSHLHVLDARPRTRRTAETHRPIQPLRARSQSWLWQKNFGAGINAWNHGMNIWKSRRRVWYLRRGRTERARLVARDQRLQALGADIDAHDRDGRSPRSTLLGIRVSRPGCPRAARAARRRAARRNRRRPRCRW